MISPVRAWWRAGVMFHHGMADSVRHTDGSSSLLCRDGAELTGRMVLDATGHARKLIEFDQKFDPGYQACLILNPCTAPL